MAGGRIERPVVIVPCVRLLAGAPNIMTEQSAAAAAAASPEFLIPPQRSQGPLEDLEHWDEFLQQRYPDPAQQQQPEYETKFQTQKAKTEFRDYRKEVRPGVKEFY